MTIGLGALLVWICYRPRAFSRNDTSCFIDLTAKLLQLVLDLGSKAIGRLVARSEVTVRSAARQDWQ